MIWIYSEVVNIKNLQNKKVKNFENYEIQQKLIQAFGCPIQQNLQWSQIPDYWGAGGKGGGGLNHERLACKAVILTRHAIQDMGDADLEYLIS